ncbi:MAG: hypothetical protein LBB67_01020 [Oscillospiraceae bacterium]|jgi:hypothetical protein|nr:hypothetical protein [Oscillospiraceae bacterium]
MKKFQRTLALFLAVLILLGTTPFAVFATEGKPASKTSIDQETAFYEFLASDPVYVLPEEAANAIPAKPVLLQSGNNAAQWPAQMVKTQSITSAQTAALKSLQDLDISIDMTDHGVTPDQFLTIFEDLINTHPELFYVNGYYYYESNGKITNVYWGYSRPIGVVKQQIKLINAKIADILAQVPDGLTDAEKVLWVNEYIVTHTWYDLSNPEIWEIYSVYGVLGAGKGVCQGYAQSFLLLMQKLGVPCIFLGSVGMNHAWNLVQIDGSWYHVDTTWNDTTLEQVLPGYSDHTFLLLSDSTISDASYFSQTHYGWAPTTYKATNNKYKNFVWTKTTSSMVNLDGKWYYAEDNKNWSFTGDAATITYKINQYDFATNVSTEVYGIDCSVSPLPASASLFKKSRFTPSLAVYDDRLYYNDGNAVYSLDKNLADKKDVNLGVSFNNENTYQSLGSISIDNATIQYAAIDGRNDPFTADTRSGSTVGTPVDYANPPEFQIGFVYLVGNTVVDAWIGDTASLYYRDHVYLGSVGLPITRAVSEDESIVTVSAKGELQVPFGASGETIVWCYTSDPNIYGYVLVSVDTAWWQWIIWIVLGGWIWYGY